MATCGTKIKQHILEHEILGLGNVLTIGGRLWVYDVIREKWLSVDRFQVIGGRNGRTRNIYLDTIDAMPFTLNGWRMIRDGTITSIAVQASSAPVWTLHVRKNGDPTNIASLQINGTLGAHITTINVDLNEGDAVQMYADVPAVTGVYDPLAWVEIAWRR